MTRADLRAPTACARLGALFGRVPRLTLLAALSAGALALGAASHFAESHALMINASPSLPYWAIWLDRSALPARANRHRTCVAISMPVYPPPTITQVST